MPKEAPTSSLDDYSRHNVAGEELDPFLASDDDGKYNLPAVLTQVMIVVHIDTGHNSVYMVSIPRDSLVSVPEVGGMHSTSCYQ